MKSKIYKILGVALTLVLLASLTVGLAGAPAGAVSSNLKFVKFDMPLVEDYNDEGSFANSEGDYWCAPATDVSAIARSPLGDTLFAAGTPDTVDPDEPWAAYEGKQGGTLLAIASDDGGVLAEYQLDAPPVLDGMSAAHGRLFLSTIGGKVLCFTGR